MARAAETRRSWTIRKPLGIGLVAVAALVGLVFVWGMTFKISGAVIAKGQVQVRRRRTAVQHPVGGVVAEILARNGDKVRGGDFVVKLDDTQLRSDLAAVEGELFEILANEARLTAELEDKKALSPDRILRVAADSNPELRALLERQQRQLDAHYKSLAARYRFFMSRPRQIDEQVSGEESALDAKRQHLALSQDELAFSEQSLAKGIVTNAVVSTLQRDVIATKGDIGQLIAKVAELKAKISEQKIKINAIPLDAKEMSADKTNQLGQQKKKLIEERRSLLYKLSKLEVQTPVSGTVYNRRSLARGRSWKRPSRSCTSSRTMSRHWFRFASMRRTSISSMRAKRLRSGSSPLTGARRPSSRAVF